MTLVGKLIIRWMISLLCEPIAKEVLNKSAEFSIGLSLILGCLFTIYFIAEKYGWLNDILKKR